MIVLCKILIFSFLIIFSLAPNLYSAPTQDGLLFYADFNNGLDAGFAKGNKKAYPQGDPAAYLTDGISGKAALVNGGKAELKYETAGNFNPEQGAISMFIYTKNFSLSDSFFHVFFDAFVSKNMFVIYKFFSTPGQICFLYQPMLNQPKHFALRTKPLEWNKGEWHHLAATWDQKQMTLYVDGKKMPSVEIDPPISDVGKYFFIGASNNRWGYLAAEPDTAIDEIRIYNRPLNDDEISNIYKEFDIVK
jgi:hypothetical protein